MEQVGAVPPAVADLVAVYGGGRGAATGRLVDGARLARAFGAGGLPAFPAFAALPIPRVRLAQALDAYASCLAEPVERRRLAAEPLFVRHQRLLPPAAADDLPRFRAIAEAACRHTGTPDAWADLAALDDLLSEPAEQDQEGTEAEAAVREHLNEIAGGLDDGAAWMLARFAVAAELPDQDPQAGVRAWRPVLEEALCIYLSLLASGVPVDGTSPEPDVGNEFPHGLTDPATWAGIRLWKFRPSPYLQELFATPGRESVERYVLAAQRLSQAMGRRLAAESPGVRTTDPASYARLLGRWNACWDLATRAARSTRPRSRREIPGLPRRPARCT
jgi:hypothetical protein